MTFRCLLKRGPANVGEFYWPNNGVVTPRDSVWARVRVRRSQKFLQLTTAFPYTIFNDATNSHGIISAIIGKDLVLKQETSPPKRQLWVRGGKGQSCDNVCKAKGKQCNEDAFTKQTGVTQNTQSTTLRKAAFMVRTISSVLSVHPPV